MRWFGLVLALLAVPAGCGRIGFELSEEHRAVEGGREGGSDASPGEGGLVLDASTDDAAPDAPVCVGTAPHVSDTCSELPELPRIPVIDGLPDCGLSLHPLTPVGWTGGTAKSDVAAQYAVAWRPEGLYFYALVTDPSAVAPRATDPASSGDGVELYVDADGDYAAPPAYDDPGTRRFVVAAPGDGVAVTSRGEVWSDTTQVAASWGSARFAAFPRSFGYVVEAFVTPEDLGLSSSAFAAGARVGWNLGVNVSYPTAGETGADGHRLGQFFAGGGGALPSEDVRALCVATLVGI